MNPQILQEAEKRICHVKADVDIYGKSKYIFKKLHLEMYLPGISHFCYASLLNTFYFSHWDMSWQEGTDFVWLQSFLQQLILMLF